MTVLLDLRGIAIRAYYNPQPYETVQGKDRLVPTGASGLKTFINFYLQPILDNFSPINIIGVMDSKDGNKRRRALYPDYKNKPAQGADDLVQTTQREICIYACQRLMLALGSPLVKCPTVEADDLVAYLVERLEGGKIIHTVDRDLLQLHRQDEVMLFYRNQQVEDFEGMNLNEVSPLLVTLHKSIVGDSSDNYGGVKRFGKGAWQNIIDAYGYDGALQLAQCVDTNDYSMIEKSLKAQPCKLLQGLLDNRTEWRLCWQLAKLHPEWCESSFGERLVAPQWAKRVPTEERIRDVLKDHGLEDMYPQFARWAVTQTGIDANNAGEIPEAMRSMVESSLVAFDYESFDKVKHPAYQEAKAGFVDVLNQEITGCSFAYGDNLQNSIYVSVNHRDTANVSNRVILKILAELDGKVPLYAHNEAFERTLTKTNLDYDFKAPVNDTVVLASHVNENRELALKLLSKQDLNYDQTTYREVVKEGDMRDVSLPEVLEYGCDDSIVTAHLAVLYNYILQCEQTIGFVQENETAFNEIMVPSFIKGIPLDYELLAKLEEEDREHRTALLSELDSLLKKHCSEVNEDGFRILWEEVSSYHKNALEAKDWSKEDIEAKLEELKKETVQNCRYVPLQIPELNFLHRSGVSAAAKSVGFPGVRSVKPAWINSYTEGMRKQAEEANYTFTDNQRNFLTSLEKLYSCGPEEFDMCCLAFIKICEAIIAEDKSTWVGDELNIDSPKQMAELFYGKMGLPILMRNIDKSDSNKRTVWDMEQAPSTNVIAIDTWLAEINNPEDWRFRVLKIILKLRAISTKFKLYYKPYPLFKSPIDGRIHPGIKNPGTKTRRPSGTSPNVLQVSKKDESKIRQVFLPYEEDHVIVSIDFVQQELVITAGESGDENLRACYVGDNRKDVHTNTGSSILNVMRSRQGKSELSYDEFTVLLKDGDKEAKAIRAKPAKITNFLMVYAGSASGLSRKATVPRETAEQFIDAFFKSYPGVRTYQDKAVNQARRHGFIKTCFGTRKHVDGIFDKNKAIRSAWERQAVNAPIQGGAADVLKIAMRNMRKKQVVERTECVIYAPVYDEIVASVPRNKVVEYIRLMEQCMEMELPGLDIGLETSVSLGKNWGIQEELGKHPSQEVIEKELSKIFNN